MLCPVSLHGGLHRKGAVVLADYKDDQDRPSTYEFATAATEDNQFDIFRHIFRLGIIVGSRLVKWHSSRHHLAKALDMSLPNGTQLRLGQQLQHVELPRQSDSVVPL